MISKNRLQQLIKEELSRAVNITEVEEEASALDDTNLTGTQSHGAMAAGSREWAQKVAKGEVDQELSNAERFLIDKVYNFLIELANTPGVDLKRARPVMETFLAKLQRQLEGMADEEIPAQAVEDEGEAEPAPTDDAGAAGAMAQKIGDALGG